MKSIYNTLGYKQVIESATGTTTDTMTLIDHLATTKDEDEDLQIENYHTIFRKDRDRHGGGVAIYVSDTIKLKKREDLQTEIESITVELDIPFVKPILITTVYRPPDSLVEISDKLESHLSRLDNEKKESIFAGDMNCNLLNSQDNDTKHEKYL